MANETPLKSPDQVQLGAVYRDIVTSFEGTAYGVTKWLTGCDTVGLKPGLKSDGDIPDAQWFDFGRLVLKAKPSRDVQAILDRQAADAKPKDAQPAVGQRRTGGPQEYPPSRA